MCRETREQRGISHCVSKESLYVLVKIEGRKRGTVNNADDIDLVLGNFTLVLRS